MAIAPTGAIQSLGVGSGLDVNSIVSQLMTLEQRPLTLLDQKEASFQAQLSAYGSLRGALSALQSAVSGLDTLSKFQSLSAVSSDNTVLTAAATTEALAGSYSVDVTRLAQKQSLVATGQASLTAAIGTGTPTTISFAFGTISGGTLTSGVYSGASFSQDAGQPGGSVTIDATNNSLQGIRDAINAAGVGVTASIVKDGSTAPYRLVLQGTSTGLAHSMRISVTGDSALQGLLAYDATGTQNLSQTGAAQDAQLAVNGVDVTSASNSVTDAAQGLTLNLIKAGSATITLAPDVAAVKQSIQGFVKAYNDLNSTIATLTSYNAQTKTGGPLLGDSAARDIQTRLRNLLGTVVPGVAEGGVRALSQAGISFQRNGTLALDAGKLDSALSENADDVARLFTSVGRATDSLISVTGSSSKTQAGTYSLNITTAATQGSFTGSAAAALTITAGVDDQLSITLDGTSATITLPAGTYTPATLAAQLQAAINGVSALSSAGSQVIVSAAAGVLSMTSTRYGSTSSITVSGTGATGLFGGTPTSSTGLDVAGTINGQPATGSGTKLSGLSGSGMDGLVLDVGGTATGSRGSITFTRGYAGLLNGLVDDFLAGAGAISSRTDGINNSIKAIDKQREALNTRLASVEQRYRAQFSALDTLISSMTTTSNFLTQQFAQLSKTTGQ